MQLARETNVESKKKRMFSGEKINWTEKRAVLHTALRSPRTAKMEFKGHDIMSDIHGILKRMENFSKRVRTGEWKGATGKSITDVVNVGIGGSDLAPQMMTEALKHYADGPRIHYVSSVDATDIAETLKKVRTSNNAISHCIENFRDTGNHDKCLHG